MKKFKTAAILICFSITLGCQQAKIKTGHIKPVSQPEAAPQEPSPPPEATPELPAQTALSEADEIEKITTPPGKAGLANLSQESKTEILTQDNPQAKAQENIDQALELCTFAQAMWEEGNLNEALGHLDAAYQMILDIDTQEFPELNQQKEDVRYLISKRVLEIYASRQIVVTGKHDAIPITLNSHVRKEIKRLTGPERKYFIQSLERAARYRPYIVEELKNAGLPEDISWLPLIESGFKLRALSSARALGLWQFIPSTGHKFGLTRNYYIDERMDPEKSTQAAIAYLKELHNLFGDWTTALAAYNCGEYRVLRNIRRQKINYLDNFWDLYQSLPRETARYVPRFLATVHIVNNLEKYGIEVKNPKSPIDYTTIEIKKQVTLADIAREIKVDTRLLKTLNPELRHGLLPPDLYQIKIPTDKSELFLAKLDTIKSTYTPPPMYTYHRVRKGDTLSGIARRYKTSVRAISRANNIGRNHTIIAGKVIKVPSRHYNGSINVAGKNSAATGKTGSSVKYKVKSGDNLWFIAKRFSTTTKQIMTQNKLSSTHLYIGQTLYISSGAPSLHPNKSGTYKVKSGDSPFLIAKRYNMSLNRLLALNHLDERSKIFPGQKLIIE